MATISETTRRRLEVQGMLGLLLEKHARPRPDAVHQVGRAVLGHVVGLNGYTTVEQAQALHEHLALSSHTRLLDVGAGHGWPGSHLAASSGCRLVATDLPVDTLRAAKRHIRQASAVSADGRKLPFRSGSFDAVVHADVFCWIADKLSVLRECHRVLKPGGRVAGYVIHAPVGLSQRDMATAGELGPSDVAAAISPADLARSAGLSVVRQEDVTADFRITCETILRARNEFEEALRAEEGPEAFEEEQQKKRSMLLGIDQGLLLRSLIVAEKPWA